MTKKEEFLNDIDREILRENPRSKPRPLLKVFIEMPDLPDCEVISNSYRNMPAKRAYYDQAYDDDLRLKVKPDIRIKKWMIE